MKRVKLTALVKDDVVRASWASVVSDVGEIESYEEKPIPKDKNVIEEHDVDSLMDGAVEFANGIWISIKGFGKMSMWAMAILISGLKFMWVHGVGKKKKDKKD